MSKISFVDGGVDLIIKKGVTYFIPLGNLDEARNCLARLCFQYSLRDIKESGWSLCGGGAWVLWRERLLKAGGPDVGELPSRAKLML